MNQREVRCKMDVRGRTKEHDNRKKIENDTIQVIGNTDQDTNNRNNRNITDTRVVNATYEYVQVKRHTRRTESRILRAIAGHRPYGQR